MIMMKIEISYMPTSHPNLDEPEILLRLGFYSWTVEGVLGLLLI